MNTRADIPRSKRIGAYPGQKGLGHRQAGSKFYKRELLKVQKGEITAHIVYKKLSAIAYGQNNKDILEAISRDELGHYEFWKRHTKTDVPPDTLKIFFYVFIARFLGLTFGIKLMEKEEDSIQAACLRFQEKIPDIKKIVHHGEQHERQLFELIDEEKLTYISSVVLGLNDALVELTGVLAGLTLALQNTRLIAVVGLITGIAASMSMAASEYLATKHEDTGKNPLKACFYTGSAYVVTVIFLITPYLIFENVFFSLTFVLINATLVILLFTYYISVAKGLSFRKRFAEMAGISLTIAMINFFIGWGIRAAFGIDA